MAVTVSVPTLKSLAVMGFTLLNVAVPPLSVTVPRLNARVDVELVRLKVTVPVGVPPLEVTVAVKLWVAVLEPSAMELLPTVTAVVVVAVSVSVLARLLEPV